MPLHFLLLVWVVLSQCSTGDTIQKADKVGDRCKDKCEGINLICNKTQKICQCHKDFPMIVQTNIKTLCLKPARLGEECLHIEACLATDKNSNCTQKDHIALCKCNPEYYEIFDKSTQSSRCVLETQLLSSDLATLIGVGVGMTLFCGLTCLVLRIFARARFGPRHHHYANAHLAPPITLSTDHDAERGRGSRHSSQRSSQGGGSRRPSLLLAPPSRADGSRRASSSSIRSTASARSYSLKAHSNYHHHHQHKRPSDPNPETLLGANLNNLNKNNLLKSDTNISPSNQHSPNKAKRSGSAGAI